MSASATASVNKVSLGPWEDRWELLAIFPYKKTNDKYYLVHGKKDGNYWWFCHITPWVPSHCESGLNHDERYFGQDDQWLRLMLILVAQKGCWPAWGKGRPIRGVGGGISEQWLLWTLSMNINQMAMAIFQELCGRPFEGRMIITITTSMKFRKYKHCMKVSEKFFLPTLSLHNLSP